MKVALTAYRGHVGNVMAPILVAAGHEVVNFDTDLHRGSTFGAKPTGITIRTVAKDIRDIDSGDLEGFGALSHPVGLSNDPLGNLNPALTDSRVSVRLTKITQSVGIERSTDLRMVEHERKGMQ